MNRLLGVFMASLFVTGSITLTRDPSQGALQPRRVEVGMGPLVSGVTVDADGANASVSMVGSKTLRTVNVLWLNNTNASGAWFVRLQSNGTTGLANLVALTIGIDNGTKTNQVSVSTGLLTLSTGPLVRLPAASANRIYVTLDVSATGLASEVRFDVIAADDATEAATVVTKGRVAVT